MQPDEDSGMRRNGCRGRRQRSDSPFGPNRQMPRLSAMSFIIAVAMMGVPTIGNAQNPLASNDWTQVARMVPDGNLFDGNCNLDLSGGCTYTSATDFWQPMPNANQILFITGDRQYWGQAWYADIASIIQAANGDFNPNLTWIDAGRRGTSIGAVQGNVLFRAFHWGSPSEDPWVTLEGPHCANISVEAPCSEILWGEGAYPTVPGNSHTFLQMNHQGIEVWAREFNGSSVTVPEPDTFTLVVISVVCLVVISDRHRCRVAG